MRVLALDPPAARSRAAPAPTAFRGRSRRRCVGPLEPGAIVLVQAGIALARLDAEWAP